MENTNFNKFVIILFLLLLTAPSFVWKSIENNMSIVSVENRALAEKPTLNIKNIDEYPQNMEAYINDHLPFRNIMITLKNNFDYCFFSSTSNNKVIIGKEEWLFYNSVSDGDPIACYKGENLLSESQLKQIANNLTITKDNLATQGCQLVIFIAPNKERVYSEYMPNYYGVPATEYQAKQIVDYINQNTDVSIVYPYERLMEVKDELGSSRPLYYKADTHWNSLGAYIGSCELLKEVGIQLPKWNSLSEVKIKQTENGDLKNMLSISCSYDLGTEGIYKEWETDFQYLETEDNTLICYNKQGIPQKVFMIHDSFGNSMNPIMASVFQDYKASHISNFSYDMLGEYQPDILILEMVERYAYQLLDFKYDKVEQ